MFGNPALDASHASIYACLCSAAQSVFLKHAQLRKRSCARLQPMCYHRRLYRDDSRGDESCFAKRGSTACMPVATRLLLTVHSVTGPRDSVPICVCVLCVGYGVDGAEILKLLLCVLVATSGACSHCCCAAATARLMCYAAVGRLCCGCVASENRRPHDQVGSMICASGDVRAISRSSRRPHGKALASTWNAAAGRAGFELQKCCA